jgi:hypothetical protein
MSVSSVPGLKAKHAYITDVCRRNRGDVGAIDEALARLRKEAEHLMLGWSPGAGAIFHFVLTIERPQEPAE